MMKLTEAEIKAAKARQAALMKTGDVVMKKNITLPKLDQKNGTPAKGSKTPKKK